MITVMSNQNFVIVIFIFKLNCEYLNRNVLIDLIRNILINLIRNSLYWFKFFILFKSNKILLKLYKNEIIFIFWKKFMWKLINNTTRFQIKFDLSKISGFMKKTFIDAKDLDNNISI